MTLRYCDLLSEDESVAEEFGKGIRMGGYLMVHMGRRGRIVLHAAYDEMGDM